MAIDVVEATRHLLEQMVRGVPGVRGAIVATVDGFSLGHYLLPDPASDEPTDPDALAAMTAAALGIATRLTATVGVTPLSEATMSSADGHVLMLRVGDLAAMTVLTRVHADLTRVRLVARELAPGVERLLRSIAPVPAGTT
jgi:uncharacterized protein